MSDIYYTEAGSGVPTPNSGYTRHFYDTSDLALRTRDTTGYVKNYWTPVNWSTASQSPTATTRTYISGSKITVPSTKLQIGSMYRWSFNMTKTAAGTATSTLDICFGTSGTTSDTARVSFTKPAGTAVGDEGWVTITAIMRGPLTVTGVCSGQLVLVHNLAATGHATIPCVVVNTISSGFDVTLASLFIGVCLTSGASDGITIQQCMTEAFNL